MAKNQGVSKEVIIVAIVAIAAIAMYGLGLMYASQAANEKNTAGVAYIQSSSLKDQFADYAASKYLDTDTSNMAPKICQFGSENCYKTKETCKTPLGESGCKYVCENDGVFCPTCVRC